MKNLFYSFLILVVLQNFVFANSSTSYNQSATQNSMFYSSSVNTNYNSKTINNTNEVLKPQNISNVQQIKRTNNSTSIKIEYPKFAPIKFTPPKITYPKFSYPKIRISYPKFTHPKFAPPKFTPPRFNRNMSARIPYVRPTIKMSSPYKLLKSSNNYKTYASSSKKNSIKKGSYEKYSSNYNRNSYGTYSKYSHSRPSGVRSYPKPTYAKYSSTSQYGKYSINTKEYMKNMNKQQFSNMEFTQRQQWGSL